MPCDQKNPERVRDNDKYIFGGGEDIEILNVFNLETPKSFIGKTLLESNIRKDTGCGVLSIKQNGQQEINPHPDTKLNSDNELVLIGNVEQESQFMNLYFEEQ